MKNRRELLKALPFLAALPFVRIPNTSPERYWEGTTVPRTMPVPEFKLLEMPKIPAEMQKSLDYMTQLFDNPQVMAELSKKSTRVDIEEIFRAMTDACGWKNQYKIIS